MCRGSDLGICCAQDCDARIRCRDTGGYCDEHSPYNYSWDEDDDSETVEAAPVVVDDPEKRRAYTLAGLTAEIRRTENSISQDERRLSEMRARASALTP